jgi:type IV pilus assembly protein PilA
MLGGEMMKDNKGFTLIELLAVIVVIAIIALISMPIMLRLIGNERKESSLNGAYAAMYAISTKLYSISDVTKPVTCDKVDAKVITCKDSSEIPNEISVTIDVSGIDSINLVYDSMKFSGTVTINDYEWEVNENGWSFNE